MTNEHLKKQYNIEILADNELHCQEALSLIKKLLHTFSEEMVWKEDGFTLRVKVDQISSHDI
jgi:hypothetical protein